MSNIIPQLKPVPNNSWLFQLKNVITDPDELFALLQLNSDLLTQYDRLAKKQFPLRVPRTFVSRIKKGDIRDPLLLQVLNSGKELIQTIGFDLDPIKEHQNSIPGLLHKYKNRVLLIVKTGCAIHCRYCFRRYFPYQQNQGRKKNWLNALHYINEHPELEEVILSGGDPLMAKDDELDWLISEIELISHIKRVRFHSRLLVVIPDRITRELCYRLSISRLQIIMVTHINHPNEIDPSVTHAISNLRRHHVTLFNQSVLLKNVNDNVDTLYQLSNKLFDNGILPYYLHLLDKVQGSGHFLINDDDARSIMKKLAEKLPGYLLPKLCREVPGEKSKSLLTY